MFHILLLKVLDDQPVKKSPPPTWKWKVRCSVHKNSLLDPKKKLRGFSPQANYIDRATAACRRN
jgi:hypothetical protein